MGLFQRDLRKLFKLEKETYANWEKDRCYPAMRHWPKIIAFLGYDPTPEPATLGGKAPCAPSPPRSEQERTRNLAWD